MAKMFYGIVVWWKAFVKTTVSKQLERVQRAALIIALRTRPTMAVNFILFSCPVDIAGRCMLAKSAISFREAGYMRGRDSLKFPITAISLIRI